MAGIGKIRALRSLVLLAAGLALFALVGMSDAHAQAVNKTRLAAIVDKSLGTNGGIKVWDANETDPFAPYKVYIVARTSGYPENLHWVFDGFIGFTINGLKTVVAVAAFDTVTPQPPFTARASIKSVSPLSALASAAAIAGTVKVSNDADAFAATCDGMFSLVVGSSSAGTPVAMVDLTTLKQVATLSYANQLARDVAIGDDGQTGLVVLDNATITNASTIARVTIGANGTLSDSGVKLSFGANDYVVKVRVAPGSHTGVALVNAISGGGARLVSFALPGLESRGSVALAANIGNAIAFDGSGRKIYARSGARAITPDVIEVFDFDSATGTLAQTASLTIRNVSGFTGTAFANPMDVSADGTLIVAAEENAAGELPAPRVTAFSTATGAITNTFKLSALSKPQTVAMMPPCALSAPGVDMNQHGLTGSWYEPATSGQGIEVEIFPNLSAPGVGFAQVSWFTFDTTAGGADRQRWYTLGGNVAAGQPASLTIFQNVGGNFNALPVTSAQAVGSASLSFDTCTSGVLQFNFTDGSSRAGSIPLTRLTQNVTCASTGAGSLNADFALSGNWYDPATSGQGVSVEVNANSHALFFAWYTYAPNGAASGAAGQRWYTGQAGYAAGSRSIPFQLYETTGGAFNAASPAPNTVPVGNGTLTFQSCTSASLEYAFTGSSNIGRAGTLHLTRVGPVPPGCVS